MTHLSARTQALVDRARKEAEPSAADLQHLRGRLAESLAGQSPDPVLLPFSLGKLAGLMMVAAVGVGAWVLRGALAEHERPPPPVPVAVVVAPPVPVAPPAVVVPVPESCAPAKAVACAPTEEAEATKRRRKEQSLFSVAAAQKDPSLELQLLVLARVALDEERSMDALGHTLRHEELYPESAFVEERLAIQVLAYCAAGNKEQATKRFERLMAVAPETTYLPRIRGTCGGEP